MASASRVAEGVHRVEDAYVNWYLLEEDGEVTIVDAGHPRSWRLLEPTLRAIGRRPADVAALVLTHGHFDHVGFAGRAQRELGVPVLAPAAELPVVSHPWRYRHERSRVPYLVRHPEFRRALLAMTRAGALWCRGTDAALPLPDGPLDVPGRPLLVPTPGHTLGHVALHLPQRGVLLAGDAVVTFDPYTGEERPKIVAAAATADSPRALQSLDAVAATVAEVVLTGHGPPWTQGAAAIAERAREAGPT